MKKLILATLSLMALGAEVDHYSALDIKLNDISDEVNQRANKFLSQAVEEVNAKANCSDSIKSEKELYNQLALYFNNHTKGIFLKELLHSDGIERRVIPLKESIFGNWSVWNGYLLGRKKAQTSPLALTPIIKIGEQEVGIDKFEHLFGMGRRYFTDYYLKNKHIRKVLKKGVFKEKTILGGNVIATGVFSYGDLSANFNGMRFWNHMLLKRDDILGKEYNRGPFIKCVDKKWEVSKTAAIDFRDYMDASMDESINCSKFASRKGIKKYKKYLKNKSKANNLSLTCPMNPELLEEMKVKYDVKFKGLKKSISHWIINEKGNSKVSYFNEF